jgi:hypothetical protein
VEPTNLQRVYIIPGPRSIVLVSPGFLTPQLEYDFMETDTAAVYVEVYDPLLVGPNPPKIAIELTIADRKTGQQQMSPARIDLQPFLLKDNPVVPVGLKLPLSSLATGAYRIQLKASDVAGNYSVVRTADFDVE